MILYFHVNAPHKWVLLDRRSEVVDSGISETLAALPLPKRVNQLAAVLPGERVAIHQVELPARSRSKALATIPYALEERLAADVDELVFTMLDWKSGEYAVVAVIERDYIDRLRIELSVLTKNVDVFVPDFLLVPRHQQARLTLARTDEGTYALRSGEYGGMTFDSVALDYWWESLGDPHLPLAANDHDSARRLIDLGGTAVSEWNIGEDFTHWLAHGHTHIDRINVFKGLNPAEHLSSSRLFRAAVLVLCLGMLAKVGVDIFENYRLYEQSKRMEGEIVQIFQQAFPDVRRIVNPRLQMAQRLGKLKAGSAAAGQFQLLMSSVAKALPAAKAVLDEVSFRDNMLLITCTTADFAGLDLIKQRFAGDARVQVELVSSGSRDNRVSARFKLQSA